MLTFTICCTAAPIRNITQLNAHAPVVKLITKYNTTIIIQIALVYVETLCSLDCVSPSVINAAFMICSAAAPIKNMIHVICHACVAKLIKMYAATTISQNALEYALRLSVGCCCGCCGCCCSSIFIHHPYLVEALMICSVAAAIRNMIHVMYQAIVRKLMMK